MTSDNREVPGLDNVRHLPVRAQDDEVVDAEIVDEDDYAARQRELAAVRREGYRQDVIVVVRTVRTVATHQHTRAVLRHALYVVAGALYLGKRAWEARSMARWDRIIRGLQESGQYAELIEAMKLREAALSDRHGRRMDWIASPGKLVPRMLLTLAGLAALLLLIGGAMAYANRRISDLITPIRAVADVVAWVCWVVAIAWGPLVLAVPWLLVLLLWHLGRRSGQAPAWVMPEAVRMSVGGELITPSIVVKALRDLGIPELRKKIDAMDDGAASLLGPIRLAGCGVEVDVLLPSGATTTLEVQNRRRRLAENLNRHEHELYITIPPQPRTVRLWVADSGALDEPIGPSPLVLDPDMVADLYTGRAPWGEDLRGDAVALPLLQRHLLCTGLSNQGKTASLRSLALWLVKDPTVEPRIADLKGIGDWHMFAGIATVLHEGPTDAHVIAATEMLEWGVGEMERRTAELDPDEYPDGVTRDLARKKGSGYHPIFLIVDEAQVAFMCPAKDEDGAPYGGKSNKSRFFMAARKILNQGRAVNVILWFGTQDPTDQNLPKLVREAFHIRSSLVLGTEEQSRMAVGDKAVNGGAAPHKLRQGLDKGTLVVAGDGVPLAPGQASLTVRTHFIDGTAATSIATAARQRRGPQDARPALEQPPRDLLADVVEVMDGKPRIRSSQVLKWLGESWPKAYGKWSAQRFAAELRAAGVSIRKGRAEGLEGQQYLDSDEVLDTIDQRAEQTGDTPEDP